MKVKPQIFPSNILASLQIYNLNILQQIYTFYRSRRNFLTASILFYLVSSYVAWGEFQQGHDAFSISVDGVLPVFPLSSMNVGLMWEWSSLWPSAVPMQNTQPSHSNCIYYWDKDGFGAKGRLADVWFERDQSAAHRKQKEQMAKRILGLLAQSSREEWI